MAAAPVTPESPPHSTASYDGRAGTSSAIGTSAASPTSATNAVTTTAGVRFAASPPKKSATP